MSLLTRACGIDGDAGRRQRSRKSFDFRLTQSVFDGGRAERGTRTICAAQDRNLLLLLSDDFLGQSPQLIVVAVLELRLRHVDRGLMMGNHDVGKIAIDIAGRRDEHVTVHVAHREIVGEKELSLFSFLRPLSRVKRAFRRLRQSKRHSRDRQGRCQ
jgi:hypothetical protein